ncbi:hypothetical protein HDU67_000684, partial [Dinochytrium kinnereticum]
ELTSSIDLSHILIIALQTSTSSTLASRSLPPATRSRLNLTVSLILRALISHRLFSSSKFLTRLLRSVSSFLWNAGHRDAIDSIASPGGSDDDVRAVAWLLKRGSGEVEWEAGSLGETAVDAVAARLRGGEVAAAMMGLIAFPTGVQTRRRMSIRRKPPNGVFERIADEAALSRDQEVCWAASAAALMAAWSGGDEEVERRAFERWVDVDKDGSYEVGGSKWSAAVAMFAVLSSRRSDWAGALEASMALESALGENVDGGGLPAIVEFCALSWCLKVAMSSDDAASLVMPPPPLEMFSGTLCGGFGSDRVERLHPRMVAVARKVLMRMRRLAPVVAGSVGKGAGCLECVLAWGDVIY